MNKLSIALAAVTLLAFSGCGGDICSRIESTSKSLTTKTAACSDTTASVNITKASCTESLKSCTAEDQDKLNMWFDCIDKLPACVSGQSNTFTGNFIGCATTHMMGISTACQAAFSK